MSAQDSASRDAPSSDSLDAMPPIDFSGMIISFGTSALINMGSMPDPDTQETRLDLVAAKQTIDMLAMLQEKTQGNLTHEEEQLLTKLVLELKLAYVKRCPNGGSAD